MDGKGDAKRNCLCCKKKRQRHTRLTHRSQPLPILLRVKRSETTVNTVTEHKN